VAFLPIRNDNESVAGPHFIFGVFFSGFYLAAISARSALSKSASNVPSATSQATRCQASHNSTFSRKPRPVFLMHHTNAAGYNRSDLPRRCVQSAICSRIVAPDRTHLFEPLGELVRELVFYS